MSTSVAYKVRFIRECEVQELLNLWHTSHTPHSGRHARLLKTVEWFIGGHPEYGETEVYKDLTALLEDY